MASAELAALARRIAAGDAENVPSPCVSVCRMDAATGLCEGCCRTLDEIAAWSQLDAPAKRAVWRRIAQRTEAPMKQITFFLDFISPYAYLAFEQLPQALQGLSYEVEYRPVLFAGLLKQHGQLGPAEIAPKRDWTYRQVLWQAHRHGIEMRMPATHPFNPLSLLRLAIACGSGGSANRYVCESVFRHVWRGGAEAADPKRLEALVAQLKPARDLAAEDVKAELKANTEAALAQGVFGVPTCAVDGKLFWGFDALPMLREYLEGGEWFASGAWDAAPQVGSGIVRSR